MKNNFIKILLIFTAFLLVACTNSNDSSCGNLEPNGNEFTLNCNNYIANVGRLHINSSGSNGVTTCWLEIVNSEHGDFQFDGDEENINYTYIWLNVPSESYTTNEIPEGTYTLKHLNSDIGEQYVVYDIADWNRIIYGGSTYLLDGSTYFNHEQVIGSEFDEVTTTISKTGEVYTINYFLRAGNKIIKGRFVGELSVIH